MHTYQSVIAVSLLTVVWAFSLQPISYSLHNSLPSVHIQETFAAQAQGNNDVGPHRGSGR
ncbi:MAG TPA: hypothetical protein V6C63_18400 [Allocoleopsis sp.]